MAIFSNLTGTMQKTFILGKNGARFDTDGTAIKVTNYQGTKLIPVSAADPVLNSHLVTLSYFNSHGGGGGGAGNILRGTNAPAPTLGTDGDIYFQVDATNIIQLYIKDQGIWKPFNGGGPVTDTAYVTSYPVTPQDFVLKTGSTDIYQYTLMETVHDRGDDLLIEVQDSTGNVLDSDVQMDNQGNIQLFVTGLPTTNINIQLIGATAMTNPYSVLVDKSKWVASGDQFTLTITAAEHEQEPGALYLGVYANVTPGATASAPFDEVHVDSSIDASGNIVFTSYESFSGKIVISGK